MTALILTDAGTGWMIKLPVFLMDCVSRMPAEVTDRAMTIQLTVDSLLVKPPITTSALSGMMTAASRQIAVAIQSDMFVMCFMVYGINKKGVQTFLRS